ncbi:YtxH domain-containing protein [Caryophanon tenue]|uniref:YtxH domain-containing protein n=1 Tax=Caryophanon tenue TaxID=33978 RepID=A0A1C0YMC8_9BACL|nr:YtxH domain-containing protein [Caryophanon tenue]OCS88308.1 hypothetical protein A6M13_00240 [Caryophanon tenue]
MTQRKPYTVDPVYADESATTKDFILGAVVGAVIGAAAALLLAPKSGHELRQNVATQAGTLRDKSVALSSTAKEKTAEFSSTAVDKTKELAQKAQPLTEKVTPLVEKVKAVVPSSTPKQPTDDGTANMDEEPLTPEEKAAALESGLDPRGDNGDTTDGVEALDADVEEALRKVSEAKDKYK